MKINEMIFRKVMFYRCPEISETLLNKLITKYHRDINSGVLKPKQIMVYDCVLQDKIMHNHEVSNVKSKQRLTEIILRGIPPISDDQSYSIEIVDDEIHIRIYKNEFINLIQYVVEQLDLPEHHCDVICEEYKLLVQAIEYIKKYKITDVSQEYI